jgi:shikimate kinase
MRYPRIYLTGFMGSGKSTVGKLLADLLNSPFTDLDEIIVQRAGMSIPDIFESLGEKAFRRMEAEAVRLCSADEGIFGLGGGAVLDPGNRDILMASGLVVYLRASTDTLARRLRSEDGGRPLLSEEGDLKDRITSLLEERSGSYELAHWSIDTDGLTPEQVASNLQKRIREEIGD